MLGSLAKWLRILGFDTFYARRDLQDEDVLNIAKKENRVLITRDVELVWKSKKNNIKTIKITSTLLDEQLAVVLKNIKIDKKSLLSRCTICNTPVETIEKHLVKKRVPKKVFENNNTFWRCPRCDKIYWKGSHFEKILGKINEIEKKSD